MKVETSAQTALVSLPICLIDALLTIRSVLDEDVTGAFSLHSPSGVSFERVTVEGFLADRVGDAHLDLPAQGREGLFICQG